MKTRKVNPQSIRPAMRLLALFHGSLTCLLGWLIVCQLCINFDWLLSGRKSAGLLVVLLFAFCAGVVLTWRLMARTRHARPKR